MSETQPAPAASTAAVEPEHEYIMHDDPTAAQSSTGNAASGVHGYVVDDEGPTASVAQHVHPAAASTAISDEQSQSQQAQHEQQESHEPEPEPAISSVFVPAPSSPIAVKDSSLTLASSVPSPPNHTPRFQPPSSPPPTVATNSKNIVINNGGTTFAVSAEASPNANANAGVGASATPGSNGIVGPGPSSSSSGTSRQASRNASNSNVNNTRSERVQREHMQNPEWGLKDIVWPPEPWENQPQRRVKIITQNANGPCSFIAICNVLILRGKITIMPPDRPSASYEYLSMLIGDYLLELGLEVDLSAVFSILPKTQFGLDLNPLFTGISSFRPEGEDGQLKLFDFAGIKLVHGWLADPSSIEFDALSKTEDYDTSMDVIVAADALTGGKFADGSQYPDQDINLDLGLDDLNLNSNHTRAGGSSSAAFAARPGPTSGFASGARAPKLSEEDHRKIQEAILIKGWFDSNPTQLTYYGLFALNDSDYIKPNELVCFFRGSHFSVLYKRLDPHTNTTMLWTLVTDRVFLRESSVIWESLVDVDGQSASFVDSHFIKSTPVGGDFAGQTGEQVARAYERREENEAISRDMRLARQLQHEEDQYAQQVFEEQRLRRLRQRTGEQRPGQERDQQGSVEGEGLDPNDRAPLVGRNGRERKPKKKKSKGECVIM